MHAHHHGFAHVMKARMSPRLQVLRPLTDSSIPKPECEIALSLFVFGTRANAPYFVKGAGVSMRGSISARVAAL